MRDPVLLQAALSHAAVHIDMINGRQSSKLAVVLTKEAIRLINERLLSKSLMVDNELIGAVAIIACNSVSFHTASTLHFLTCCIKNLIGDTRESQIHMDALKEMVAMKGGRESLDDFIRSLLSWQVKCLQSTT